MIVLFGAATSPLVVLAIPAAILTGMAFAAPIAAFSATQKTPNKFAAIFRFGITPLFLFSGTFFPLESLPEALQPAGLDDAALPRRRADPRPVARDHRSTIRCSPSIHVLVLCGLRRRSGRWSRSGRSSAGWSADDRPARHCPRSPFGSRRSARLIERNLYVYKHGWMVILSGFFEPLFYLLGIGFGLGALIGTIPGPAASPISYQLFVAPALLASSAMNGAIMESTFNFFFKLSYNKTFTSILATPLSPGDIALGELGWALIRGALYALGFMGVMVVLGLVVSPWAILVLPAALLIGFAFGAVGMAATSFMKTWQDFDLIQLVVLPMFLFSGHVLPDRGVSGCAPDRRPADAALPGRRPDPVADGRCRLADPALPRRLPRRDGDRGAGHHLAPARQAAAQLGGGSPAA